MVSTEAAAQEAMALKMADDDLSAYARTEARRLGMPEPRGRWRDPKPHEFPASAKNATTILFGGLTIAHDVVIEAALESLGYRARALPYPDQTALQLGKEFCSRGVCNPTYFTTGSLIGTLRHLRDAEGLSIEEIEAKYLFATPSSCGPCRFGTYVTEYRKALRDAGFPNFRVVDLVEEHPGERLGEDTALELGPLFYRTALRCLIVGDVVNAQCFRIRPYEIESGATDRALGRCLEILSDAFRQRHSIIRALRRCRAEFDRVPVDRLKPKPRVAVIGEFWAMHADGAGNYDLKRFLESEGAEVEIPLVTNGLLYHIWCFDADLRQEMAMRRTHAAKAGDSRHPRLSILAAEVLRRLVLLIFRVYARAIGLNGYHVADMGRLARLSDAYYPNELRGGEGHIEVGKVIDIAERRKADLVVSVKPFGCMPSSSVSDGIQALVVSRYPTVNFIAVETTGDGAMNVYSRVQMALFKARSRADEAFSAALAETGLTGESAAQRLAPGSRLSRATEYPIGPSSVTAANLVYQLGDRRRPAPSIDVR